MVVICGLQVSQFIGVVGEVLIRIYISYCVLGKLYAAARVAAILKIYAQLTGDTVPELGDPSRITETIAIEEFGGNPDVENTSVVEAAA